MVESLEEIYKGTATIIKNKNYFAAQSYLSPFIEKMSNYTDKFICNVKVADQLSEVDGEINTVYNKVLVTAVFPDNYNITLSDGSVFHRVTCMSYALDVKVPNCKFYTGVVDTEFNFYSFGADCITIQKIEPENPIDYTGIEQIVQNGLNDNCATILEQNMHRVLDKNNILNDLGEWIDFTLKKEYINDVGKVKLSNSMPIEAYKRLAMDKDSPLYEEGNAIPIPNVMKAFLEQITDDEKDIINRYEKTQLINNLMKL